MDVNICRNIAVIAPSALLRRVSWLTPLSVRLVDVCQTHHDTSLELPRVIILKTSCFCLMLLVLEHFFSQSVLA